MKKNIKLTYMKNIFLLLFYCFAASSFKADSQKLDSCECKNIPLYGKVKFVTSFPDFKIQFVENFPDLKVQFVSSFPNKCGQWQVVESFPDFTVEVVNNFPDFKVKTVDNFPGLP
jgi:hypothetical protein